MKFYWHGFMMDGGFQQGDRGSYWEPPTGSEFDCGDVVVECCGESKEFLDENEFELPWRPTKDGERVPDEVVSEMFDRWDSEIQEDADANYQCEMEMAYDEHMEAKGDAMREGGW